MARVKKHGGGQVMQTPRPFLNPRMQPRRPRGFPSPFGQPRRPRGFPSPFGQPRRPRRGIPDPWQPRGMSNPSRPFGQPRRPATSAPKQQMRDFLQRLATQKNEQSRGNARRSQLIAEGNRTRGTQKQYGNQATMRNARYFP